MRLSFFAGVGLGAGLMYFLDPARGRARRARLGNLRIHASHAGRALLAKARQDAEQRARGLIARAKHALGPKAEVDDDVMVERMRARLGRVVSNPHAIEIRVEHGQVVLDGEVYDDEAGSALGAIRTLAGSHDLSDRMTRRPTDGVDRTRPRGTTWTPALRVGAMAGGALLAGLGLVRRGPAGVACGIAGGALVLRAGSNRPLRGASTIRVQKTIAIHAPIDRVFALWSRFEEFPKFMSHVREVRVTGERSHWVVDGPLGVPARFAAEITEREPDRTLAWHTLPGEEIQHAGHVRFEAVDGGTLVHLSMSYHPPAGTLGHALARILRGDPKHRIDDDLLRMKSLLEDGHIRNAGHRFDLSQL